MRVSLTIYTCPLNVRRLCHANIAQPDQSANILSYSILDSNVTIAQHSGTHVEDKPTHRQTYIRRSGAEKRKVIQYNTRH
jgi:hypothetical protein